MLLLLLHNDENFLNRLLCNIQEQEDVEASIHDTEGLGEEIIGSRLDVFSRVRWTSMGDRFDHALIVVLKNRERLADLRQLIIHYMDLYRFSGRGLLLTLPYASITKLEQNLRGVKTNRSLLLVKS